MFLFPLYVGWGLLISGLPAAWRYADLPQFSYVILTGYLLLSFLPAQMRRLPVIDAWPVSRRRLFAFLMLPPLLALAAGLGSGRIGALLLEKSRPQILYQQKESAFFPPYPWKTPLIRVPAQYCGIAWDGRPPELTSPWGESRPAWSHPLYRGSRIVVYAPFSTSEVGSPRFVALQISRAIQAIYGKSVPWEEVLSRYLETEGDGGVRLKGGELALLADYPDLEPQGDIPLFPLLLLMSATVWLIMAGVFLRSCRAHVTDAGRVRTFAVLAAFAIATTMAQLGVMVAGLLRPDAGAAFLRILLLRYAAAAPGGEWILWIVCFLWLSVLYGLVQNRFDRIEVLPGRPVPE
jgi:hypothetical protein